MKYLIILLLVIISVHPISYAAFCWKQKNRIGAVGVTLLALAAVTVPAYYVMIR